MAEAKKFKYTFLCKRFPEISILYKRAEYALGDGNRLRKIANEQSIGFRKTPLGGIYKTNSGEEAKFIQDAPQFEEGLIVLMDEKEFVKALTEAPVNEGILQGDAAVVDSGVKEPVAPADTPPEAPVAARTRGLGRRQV
jgi:hypothetical protein